MSTHEIYTCPLSIIEKNAEALASEIRKNLCEYEVGVKDSFDAYFPLNGCDDSEVLEKGDLNDVAQVKFLDMIDATKISDTEILCGSGIRLFYAISSHKIAVDDGSFDNIPFMAHYSSEPVSPTIPDNEKIKEIEIQATQQRKEAEASNSTDCVAKSLKDLVEQARAIGEHTIKSLFDRGYNVADIDKMMCSGKLEE